MLWGIKKYYEDFHRVDITEEAVRSAVDLSIRYIHDNFLPDKAIDLIDEAAAAVRVRQHESALDKKRHKLLDALSHAQEQKAQALHAEALEDAVVWKEKEGTLQKQLTILNRKETKDYGPRDAVTNRDIASVLAARIQLDPERLLRHESDYLPEVEKELKKNIIGQDEVIGELIRGLRQAYLGLGNKRKPLASFLFAGPSGVGKTALCKALAQSLYHDAKALLKLDMTEFAESHSVSKLLGSPAGYIGYKERNRFTEELKKRPYAVLVFDEYDKAHPDVQKLLFQILDEGELTDSQGKKVYFHHAIIILTTNVGAELYESGGIGFSSVGKTHTKTLDSVTKEHILHKLKDYFGASLLGRVGHTLLFRPLDATDRAQIVLNLFRNFSAELMNSHVLDRA